MNNFVQKFCPDKFKCPHDGFLSCLDKWLTRPDNSSGTLKSRHKGKKYFYHTPDGIPFLSARRSSKHRFITLL